MPISGCGHFLSPHILSLIFRPALVAVVCNSTGVSRVHDPYAKGRSLAWKVVQLQCWAGALFAAALSLASGRMDLGLGALWGAGSVAAAQAAFAWRQMQGVAAVAKLLRRFYGAAAWKWLVLFALFALGLVVLRLPAGGLLAGLIAAQIAGTLGLIRYG